MQRASDVFNEEQKQHVSQAVADAESRTSCEIVPVVASSSGRYDRPEDIVGLWLATITAVVVWAMFPREPAVSGSWGAGSVSLGVLIMAAGVVIAFIVGTVCGSRVSWLRRLFSPKKQLQEEVATRARGVFFDNRIHHTAGSTGILIYVSLFEHMAVVLGDQEVLEKIGQSSIDALCGQLTDELKKSHPADALIAVITTAGEQLAGVLPRAENDNNELQDALVLID
ncbi:MAG: putative membrane protein [Planctomycetaceae bacterium]|jgi:putative membrane protein